MLCSHLQKVDQTSWRSYQDLDTITQLARLLTLGHAAVLNRKSEHQGGPK